MVCRTTCVLALLLGVLNPVWAQKEENSKPGVGLKTNGQLMWTADPNYVVTIGLADRMSMDLPSALAVLRHLNAADSDNFGFGDWRLPTPWELRLMVSNNQEDSDSARAKGPAVKRLLDTIARHLDMQAAKSGEKPVDAEVSDLVHVWPIRGSGVLPGISQVAVFATNSIQLKEGAAIHSGSVVVNEASPGPTLAGGVELMVGIRATTPAGYHLAADSIFIKSNAVVSGDVLVNELDNNGTVEGSISAYAPPIFTLLPAFETTPMEEGDPPADITVLQGETITLDAGQYAILKVKQNGSVQFTGGIYDFTEFDAGTGTTMTFDTPSIVRIAGKLAVDQNSFTGPFPGSGFLASDIVFYVNGVNGNNGNFGATPRAGKVGLNADFLANLYVPNGTVWLRQNARITGAVLARDVIVGDGTEVTLASYFVNQAPLAGNDQIIVNAGGTTSLLTGGETSLLANDTDPENDLLTVSTTPLSGPSNGTVDLQADGTFTYTHDGSATTSDSFLYEVCDDGTPQQCSIGQVSITIAAGTITVTVSTTGEGSGSISSDPAGLDCDEICSAIFPNTRPIFLTADADPGSVFTGWSGDADCFDGVVNPDTDKNCIANFALSEPPPTETIQVTVAKTGDGSGLVLSDPGGIFCGEDCDQTFLLNTRVELSAIADPGSIFTGWSGDPDCADGLLNGTEDTDCIANFDAEPPPPQGFDLHVIITGGGEAGVATNPSGLICSDDCTATFAAGTQLNLLIRPSPGSVFIGWSGDCSGSSFITPLLMDSDKECTATVVQQ